MSGYGLARQLFAPPGAVAAHTRHLLAQAAGSHAHLLHSAVAAHHEQLDALRETFGEYLRGPASVGEKRFVLDDPQFVEALHALSSASDDLADWDATVAPNCYHAPVEREASLGRGRLGNVVAAVVLRQCRTWRGQIEVATDAYGRVHFPFCDWALVLVDQRSEGGELLAHQRLILELDEHEVRWSLQKQGSPLVRMPRPVFDAMFVDNQAAVRGEGVKYSAGPLRSRFERAARLNDTKIRFEPIVTTDVPAAHAELTGGIVAALVAAIDRNAPHIHEQLCQCVRTIQGFELPPYAVGHIASFSVPTSPGVIGFNVQYTPRDEPRLSPYCFMWLGHELGHTLHYMIDDVAYLHGWRFLENPGEKTPIITRYGRSLSVRTLFQVPYVHLFEWWLLMLFQEQNFAGLPWQTFGDTFAVGEDLRAEIDESFAMIDEYARLTPMGHAVLVRLRELVAEAESHWRRLSFVAIGA